MGSLAVVCFFWYDPQSKWRDSYWYRAKHVHALRNMVGRHLTVPHRFVCVTDGHEDMGDIETRPLDTSLITPSERYAKLMIFRPDAAEFFGADRILMLDLDVVICGNIDHLTEHGEPFMAWKNPRFWRKPRNSNSRRSRYNSSVVYVESGAKPEIWTRFDIRESRARVLKSGVCGTDQEWMSSQIVPDDQGWMSADTKDTKGFDESDGIYSWKIHCRGKPKPRDPRVVVVHGRYMPDQKEVQRATPWIVEHYQ